MYFLKNPLTLTLTPSLSSFTKLITLDAGIWDKSKVSLDDVKTFSHPTTGELRIFVAPDNLDTISTDKQFGDTSADKLTKLTSFTARGLENITGNYAFVNAVINILNLPSLTDIGTSTISSSSTFSALNTNGNPLSLPKLTTITGNGTFSHTKTGTIDLPSLTTITGNTTFYLATAGAIYLPSLTTITGSDTFSNLRSSTLTLRTNLKIAKQPFDGVDNFDSCCSDNSISNTFLNLLYSTNEGTDMTGVNLKGTETISGKPGQWKMNANQSNFLTKLRTITLRPAEGM
ncbi:MAG: leucine-rich repeat protein, partial [Holosporales bacterium]|nr:leucine-rich repeat protein [Holosporales bacterium]